jgi:Outer membrane protein beta-barrel domain
MRVFSCRAVVTLVLVSALPIVAKAQGVMAHSIEVSGNGGITNEYGANGNHGHATYGFAGAYNLTRHLAVVGEYSNVDLGSESEDVAPGQQVTGSEDVQLYGGAVRYALINTRFFVPYVLVGGGGDNLHVSVSTPLFPGDRSIEASESGGYVSLAGGVSLYAGHGFGIRPEFRYNRQQYGSTSVEGLSTQGSSENDLRVTVAVFYQFGGSPRG